MKTKKKSVRSEIKAALEGGISSYLDVCLKEHIRDRLHVYVRLDRVSIELDGDGEEIASEQINMLEEARDWSECCEDRSAMTKKQKSWFKERSKNFKAAAAILDELCK
jgi:hypothetical protein